MNRTLLCGRLMARPRLAYTPGGVAVAQFRLLVPRGQPLDGSISDRDPIDCVAFREVGEELHFWGQADQRVNLEGRLRQDTYLDESGRQCAALRVHCDRAYFVDPVVEPALRETRSLVPATVAVGKGFQ